MSAYGCVVKEFVFNLLLTVNDGVHGTVHKIQISELFYVKKMRSLGRQKCWLAQQRSGTVRDRVMKLRAKINSHLKRTLS